MKHIKYNIIFWGFLLAFLYCDKDKGVETTSIIKKGDLLYYRGEDYPYTGKYYGYSGDQKFQGYIKNGKQEGKFFVWYENGRLQTISHQKNGELNGKCTTWYSNGKKSSVSYYTNGKLDGKYTKWDLNGKISKISYYKNGIEIK
ncbi:MAG: hypothetical protein JW870_14230 [Candidatus Delongbacteria bacterium]|nr:hypothetical protein [Candidatus Delongbacteria bacterium]